MPFHGFETFAECVSKMAPKVGGVDSARKLCGKWQAEAEG